MRLGYDLTIEQSQKLVMTPELIQAIQILQFNTQELDTYVEEQLLINPILEIDGNHYEAKERAVDSDNEMDRNIGEKDYKKKDEEFDWAEHFKEREYDDISYKQWEYGNSGKEEYSFEQFVSSDITLTEHLMFQLQFISMRKSCRMLAKYMIEGLDENGYLTQSVEEIAKQFSIIPDKVEEVLKILQGFEPTGVAARDLIECLKIQLHSQGNDSPVIDKIVEEHLEDLAGNRLCAIAKAVNLSVKEVQEICDLIKSLEPKPGRQFGSAQETRYIVPDVTVEKVDGEYVIMVNDSTAPRLNISSYYQKMLTQSDKESSISKFLTSRLNSALWLIKSIEQRRQTIFNVVSAVVKYQVDFFEHGQKHLKTLTLKQIADEVGIHESTVSRSINGKYMQSPRGVFEIKYFFTSGVSASTGEGIASESIKTFIKEIVDSEDPKTPYSDQAMVELLKERGIDISRRTVAKYRDEMHILSSSKRKRY
ncbi:MAG: RNA polymerase factor sigma-54 [Anaerovorax sp.]|nr:RNA polymerase factor sigma-54 [Anaerovorax sp.]